MEKISGYITTRNCVDLNYPFEASIRSLLAFCDEVVVGDSSDSNDGTKEILEALVGEDSRVKVFHKDVDWSAPNYGVFDGQMKAFARSKCTGDILVQIDADEVFDDSTKEKFPKFLEKVNYLKDTPLAALPVIEYWGSKEKVRVDVNPWKWRVSRNNSDITHGIPGGLRWYKNGLLYCRPGSDGCDYISKLSGDITPCIHFVNKKINDARVAAITDENKVEAYQKWFQHVVDVLPTVHHFSWWNIGVKIRKFRGFWNNSWLTLYGEKQDKPEGWNPFFSNKTLDEVTEKEIDDLGIELANKTGGHIFHAPWNGKKTNSVSLNVKLPEPILLWAGANKSDNK